MHSHDSLEQALIQAVPKILQGDHSQQDRQSRGMEVDCKPIQPLREDANAILWQNNCIWTTFFVKLSTMELTISTRPEKLVMGVHLMVSGNHQVPDYWCLKTSAMQSLITLWNLVLLLRVLVWDVTIRQGETNVSLNHNMIQL